MKSKFNLAVIWMFAVGVTTVVSVDNAQAFPGSRQEAEEISRASARDRQLEWDNGREARVASGVYHASDSAYRAEQYAIAQENTVAEGRRLARTGSLAEIADFKARHEASIGQRMGQNGRYHTSNTFLDLEARERLLRAAKRGAGGSAVRAIAVGAGAFGALAAKPTDSNAATVDVNAKAFESVRFNGTASVPSEAPSFSTTAASRTSK